MRRPHPAAARAAFLRSLKPASDKRGHSLEHFAIFLFEGLHLRTLGRDYSHHALRRTNHWDHYFGAGRVKRRQVAHILAHVIDHDGLPRFRSGTTKTLGYR